MCPSLSDGPALTASLLVPIIERALGRSVAIAGWSVTPLRISLGLATGGVFRVSGGGASDAWSVVLKIVRPPFGTRHDAAARDPHHFAYWKREPLLYADGVLAGLPSAFSAPHSYAVDERASEEVWLWLEHVEDAYGPTWPREQFLRAAAHLGALSGAYLSLPDHPSPRPPSTSPLSRFDWLHDRYFRVRFEQTARAGGWPLFASAATWSHPLIAAARFPPQTAPCLLGLWNRHAALLDRLYALPQTFRHGDAHRDNLIARRTPNGEVLTTAIDWANAGTGAIGLDLLDLTLGATPDDTRDPDEAVEFAEDLFTHYAAGLLQTSPHAAIQDARAGYAIGTALAGASRLHWRLSRVLEGLETNPQVLRAEAQKTHPILTLASET